MEVLVILVLLLIVFGIPKLVDKIDKKFLSGKKWK